MLSTSACRYPPMFALNGVKLLEKMQAVGIGLASTVF